MTTKLESACELAHEDTDEARTRGSSDQLSEGRPAYQNQSLKTQGLLAGAKSAYLRLVLPTASMLPTVLYIILLIHESARSRKT